MSCHWKRNLFVSQNLLAGWLELAFVAQKGQQHLSDILRMASEQCGIKHKDMGDEEKRLKI